MKDTRNPNFYDDYFHNINEIIETYRYKFPRRTSEMCDAEILEVVEACYQNAKKLQITDPKDIDRFTCMFFLPKEKLKSPTFQSTILRAMNNLEINATKRLNFIYHNLIDE